MLGQNEWPSRQRTNRGWLFAGATLVALSAGWMVGMPSAQAAKQVPAAKLVANENTVGQVTGENEQANDAAEVTAGQPGMTTEDETTEPDNPSDHESEAINGDPEATEDETPVTPQTQASTERSDFSYSQDEFGNYVVTGYTGEAQQQANGSAPVAGYSTSITIPDTYRGVAVVGVAANAFNNDNSANDNLHIITALTAVKLGANIQWIGADAFKNNLLTSLGLPDRTWSVGDEAFMDNQLTIVDLNRVEQINRSAFQGNGITQLAVPDTTTAIAEKAFADNAITHLTLGDRLGVINTAAFQKNQIQGQLVLPASMWGLGDQAFQDNQITGITFNAQLAAINTAAFDHNALVGTLTLPTSVTAIGDNAFSNNELSTVQLPDQLTRIGTAAFENNQLASVVLPDALTDLGYRAFKNNQLTAITFGQQIHRVGTQTFANNKLPGMLTLPETITNIGEESFADNQLTGVQLGSQVASVDTDAFVRNNLQHINAAGPIGSVGQGAFAEQRQLTVTVYATTVGLAVRNAISQRLGLAHLDLAGLQFITSDGTGLAYDGVNDWLTLPAGFSGDTLVLRLTSVSEDTGEYGVQELTLQIKPAMVTAPVTIGSNRGDQTSLPVTGQVGSQVSVTVPAIEGFRSNKQTVMATVNLDGTITTTEFVMYVGGHDGRGGLPDPVVPVTPEQPTVPARPVVQPDKPVQPLTPTVMVPTTGGSTARLTPYQENHEPAGLTANRGQSTMIQLTSDQPQPDRSVSMGDERHTGTPSQAAVGQSETTSSQKSMNASATLPQTGEKPTWWQALGVAIFALLSSLGFGNRRSRRS